MAFISLFEIIQLASINWRNILDAASLLLHMWGGKWGCS